MGVQSRFVRILRIFAVLLSLGGCSEDGTAPPPEADGSVDFSQSLPDVVSGACNVVDQDCPEPQACTVGEEGLTVCTIVGDLGEFENCTDDPTGCSKGMLCLAPSGEQETKTCRRLCDRITSEPCTAEETCMATIYSGIGFCMEFEYCDPILQDCYNSSQRCYPTGTYTVCRTGGGSTPEGDLCDPLRDSCDIGLSCVEIEGETDTCRPFCRVETGEGCREGESCHEVEGFADYGVCVLN